LISRIKAVWKDCASNIPEIWKTMKEFKQLKNVHIVYTFYKVYAGNLDIIMRLFSTPHIFKKRVEKTNEILAS